MKKKCCRVSRIIVFLSVFFLMILFAGIMNVHAADNTVKRLIHVVYDDSGSMSENNKKDWCRANYSMQVFAAMLGEGDKMVVYPMSRYCDGHKVPEYSDLPTFEGGKGNLKDYIEKIKRINGGEDTPKKAVEQANKDLKSKKADDK